MVELEKCIKSQHSWSIIMLIVNKKILVLESCLNWGKNYPSQREAFQTLRVNGFLCRIWPTKSEKMVAVKEN